MIGVFSTLAPVSSGADLARALHLACDDGYDRQVSISGFRVDPATGDAGSRLILMRHPGGDGGASLLLLPAKAAEFAPLAWQWFTETHGAGTPCLLRSMATGGCRNRICEIMAHGAKDAAVTRVSGSGRTRLAVALDLCLPETAGKIGAWRLSREACPDPECDDLSPRSQVPVLHLLAEPPKRGIVAPATDLGATRLPAPLPARLVTELVAEWLGSGDLDWPREPDTDGSCERGFRVEIVEQGHVRVSPTWMVYGK